MPYELYRVYDLKRIASHHVEILLFKYNTMCDFVLVSSFTA